MTAYARANPAHWWRPTRWGRLRGSTAAMFISPLRRISMLCVLIVLTLIIGGYLYITNPQRASLLAQRLLSRAIGSAVTIGRTQISLSGTLLLDDVTLHTKLPDGTDTELFHATSLEVRLDWFSLLSGNARASQVLAYHPTLSLVEDRATGRWNYETLQRAESKSLAAESAASTPAKPKTPMQLPYIVLREATLQWEQSAGGRITQTAATTIDGQLAPDPDFVSVYNLRIDEHAEGNAAPASVKGIWDLNNGSFSATTSPIDLGELNIHSLPQAVSGWLADHALRGRVDYIRLAMDRETGITLSAALSGVSWLQEIPESVTQVPGTHVISIDDISGTLSINLSHGHVEVKDLRGRVLGQDLAADVTVDGLSADAPFDLEMQLPRGHFSLPYPDLFDDIPLAHDITQRLRPRGDFSLVASVKRTRWNGDVLTDALVTCLHMQARFAEFPYPLTDVNGSIHYIQDHIEITRLVAKAGESDVIVSGMAGTTPDNQVIDMSVRVPEGHIDERFAWCLPMNLKPTWDQFNPSGTAEIICHVQRANGTINPDIHVTISPQDISATYAGFPVPLKHVQGKIEFSDQETDVESLTGVPADGSGGRFTCSGAVHYPKDQPGTILPDLKIAATNFLFTHELLSALPESYRKWLTRAGIQGRVTLEGAITPDQHDDPTFAGTVALTGGTLQPPQFGVTLRDVTAGVTLQPDLITLTQLDGHLDNQPDAKLHVSGALSTADQRESAALAVQWQHIAIPEHPPTGLPARWADRWNTYHPAGMVSGDASATFDLTAVARSGQTTPTAAGSILQQSLKKYSGHLQLIKGHVAAESWPAGLNDVTGNVTVDPHQVVLSDVSVHSDGATMRASGTIELPSHDAALAVDIDSPQFPEAWLVKLPEAVHGAIEGQHVTGAAELHVPRLEYHAHDPDFHGPVWAFQGTVGTKHFATAGKTPVSADALAISGQGVLPASGQPQFDGKVTGSNIVLMNRAIATLSADVHTDTVKHQITVDPITALVAGGTASGAVDIPLGPPVGYDVRLVLNGADLGKLMTANDTAKAPAGTGTVDAGLSITGTFGKTQNRAGRGNVLVKNAKLYDVPLTIGAVQLLTLRLPMARAFDRAIIAYTIDGDVLKFDRIVLGSSNLDLAGIGTVNLKTDALDLNFVTRTPHDWNIPIVSDLVQTVRDQLLQIHVGGTIAKPRIDPVPLSAITGPLSDLLNGKPAAPDK
jgi:hypothetical protein